MENGSKKEENGLKKVENENHGNQCGKIKAEGVSGGGSSSRSVEGEE